MFKVILEKGNRYWDPYTSTHLKRSKREETFTDEDIKNYDMSNIEYAVQVGVLRKVDLDENTESENTEKETEEQLDTDPMSIEDSEDKVTTDEVEFEVEELDTEEKEETKEEDTANELDEDTSEETDVETLDEEEIERCQAKTSSGSQCKNEAKYPEEDPMYCHIHKSKTEE